MFLEARSDAPLPSFAQKAQYRGTLGLQRGTLAAGIGTGGWATRGTGRASVGKVPFRIARRDGPPRPAHPAPFCRAVSSVQREPSLQRLSEAVASVGPLPPVAGSSCAKRALESRRALGTQFASSAGAQVKTNLPRRRRGFECRETADMARPLRSRSRGSTV